MRYMIERSIAKRKSMDLFFNEIFPTSSSSKVTFFKSFLLREASKDLTYLN